jgi:Regulator of ribonuclease activity B/Family of unknown function (DUF695)
VTEWLSYDTKIDGASALVDVDASFDDADERPEYTRAIELTVTGFPMDGDRLPTDAADDSLYALEQQIEDLLDENDGVLAATVASAGTYQFIAYAADGVLEARLAAAARDAGLQASTASQADPNWQAYARWSLSGDALEEARDRAQIEELINVGDDLSAEHELTFDFEFDDEESAEAGQKAFRDAGFEVAEESNDVFVQVFVSLVPTPQAVRDARARMNAIAAHCGGAYAGWGAEPVEGE